MSGSWGSGSGSVRALSPDADLNLRREGKHVAAFGAIAFAFIAWWCVPELLRMQDENAILSSCQVARYVEVLQTRTGGYSSFGYVEVAFLYETDEGSVEATQSARVADHTRADFSEPSVCYQPSAPTRAVFQPLVALRGSTWKSMALALALGVFSFGALLILRWRSVRRHRRQLVALREGEPVRASIRSVATNRLFHFGAGQTVVAFALASDPGKEHRYIYPDGVSQPLTPADGKGAVAIAGGEGSTPVLLRSDGFPYVVDRHELAALAQLRSPSLALDEVAHATLAAEVVVDRPELVPVTSAVPVPSRRPSLGWRIGVLARILGRVGGAALLAVGMGTFTIVSALDAFADAAAFADGVPVDATFSWSSRSAFGLLPSYTLELETADGPERIAQFSTLYPIDLDSPEASEVRWIPAESRYLPANAANALVPRCLYALVVATLNFAVCFWLVWSVPRSWRALRGASRLARAELFLLRDDDRSSLPPWASRPEANLSWTGAPLVVESTHGARYVVVALDESGERFAVLSFEGAPLTFTRGQRAELRAQLQELADSHQTRRARSSASAP